MTCFLVLESGGTYDMSDEKFLDNMKQEIRTNMQSLAVPTPKIASEFYTAAEMVSDDCESGEHDSRKRKSSCV